MYPHMKQFQRQQELEARLPVRAARLAARPSSARRRAEVLWARAAVRARNSSADGCGDAAA
jgi:hypothetical protein